jgi:hypothetical protein
MYTTSYISFLTVEFTTKVSLISLLHFIELLFDYSFKIIKHSIIRLCIVSSNRYNGARNA